MNVMMRLLLVSLMLGSVLLGGYKVLAGGSAEATQFSATCSPVDCEEKCDTQNCRPDCGPGDCKLQ